MTGKINGDHKLLKLLSDIEHQGISREPSRETVSGAGDVLTVVSPAPTILIDLVAMMARW